MPLFIARRVRGGGRLKSTRSRTKHFRKYLSATMVIKRAIVETNPWNIYLYNILNLFMFPLLFNIACFTSHWSETRFYIGRLLYLWRDNPASFYPPLQRDTGYDLREFPASYQILRRPDISDRMCSMFYLHWSLYMWSKKPANWISGVRYTKADPYPASQYPSPSL